MITPFINRLEHKLNEMYTGVPHPDWYHEVYVTHVSKTLVKIETVCEAKTNLNTKIHDVLHLLNTCVYLVHGEYNVQDFEIEAELEQYHNRQLKRDMMLKRLNCKVLSVDEFAQLFINTRNFHSDPHVKQMLKDITSIIEHMCNHVCNAYAAGSTDLFIMGEFHYRTDWIAQDILEIAETFDKVQYRITVSITGLFSNVFIDVMRPKLLFMYFEALPFLFDINMIILGYLNI